MSFLTYPELLNALGLKVRLKVVKVVAVTLIL